MFFCLTTEKSVGPCIDHFNVLMQSIDSWNEFNPTGLDEIVIILTWSNDQVSWIVQQEPSCT